VPDNFSNAAAGVDFTALVVSLPCLGRPGFDIAVVPEHSDSSQQVGKSPDQATRNGEGTPLASDPSRLIP
jgi:hypothetical protein